MNKFVLIVDLEVIPEHMDTFLEAVRTHAANTVRLEPGCHRFDVVRSVEHECKVTHYEVFEDEAAFQAHTQTPHTIAFGGAIQPLIVKADVRRGELAVSQPK